MAKTRRAPTLHLSLFAAAAAAAAMAVLAPVTPAGAEYANPHGLAVIIGNRTYGHSDVPPVDYAHRDAEAFRRYVLDVLGYDPRNVIHIEDATRRRMVKVFGSPTARMNDIQARLSLLASEGGSDVVVYYSGHGVPGKERGASLLPVDVPPYEALTESYPLRLLYEKLGALQRTKTVRVFLDACFSGSSDGGRLVTGSPVYQEPEFPEEVTDRMMILTAVTGTEIATWDKEAKHGLFTHHLLDALYGRGDGDGDGRVTAREAKAYLDQYMTANAWLLSDREQHAVLTTRELSDLALASAGEGGAFPVRPSLEDEGSGSSGGKKEAVPPPPVETAESEEAKLELTHAQRVLVQLGLASLGFDVGVADGVFGRRTRSRISDYQRKKELPETGYLTAELRDALVAFGAARKADDEASSRARRSGTVEGLEEYLSSHPDGRHAEEIRGLLAEASKPKWPEGKKFRDCPECPEMVVVPSERFDMGSPSWEKGRSDDEGPVHRVTISEPFAAGVYEVTFREWDACHRDGVCSHNPPDAGWGRGDRPVINVSWNDAKEYVRWLSRKTGEDYRLLSESEWEYAARAGTTGPFHFGTTITPDQANYDGRYTYGTGRKGRYRQRTVPVGSFSPNAFGLHDVHGNVREWVEDCWHGSYRGARVDGSAWMSGGDCGARVLRGGSWSSGPWFLRSAIRLRSSTGLRGGNVGFRVSRTLD